MRHLYRWERHQYDFHWNNDPVPPPLLLYSKLQQDAMTANWDGLVAGIDGSVYERTERMGADMLFAISLFKFLSESC